MAEEKVMTEKVAEAPKKRRAPKVKKFGVVNGCDNLRVRSEADASADNTIKVIPYQTQVEILDSSNAKFHKISVDGVTGYVMKKFIEVK